MGMTLKELLTKGEGTLSAQEAKTLAAQCRMDVETLYTLLEERGIKILDNEVEADTSLDVDSIIAEVENAENNSDDMGTFQCHSSRHDHSDITGTEDHDILSNYSVLAVNKTLCSTCCVNACRSCSRDHDARTCSLTASHRKNDASGFYLCHSVFGVYTDHCALFRNNLQHHGI